MPTQPIRPIRPIELGPETSSERDLSALARSLMDEPAFVEHGRSAATLIQGSQFSVTVTTIRAGVALEEHHAARPTHLTLLAGEIEWDDATRSEPLVLRPGGSIAFGGALRHRVTARQDSAFVLVFGAAPAEPATT